jgi:hypothetical protein
LSVAAGHTNQVSIDLRLHELWLAGLEATNQWDIGYDPFTPYHYPTGVESASEKTQTQVRWT